MFIYRYTRTRIYKIMHNILIANIFEYICSEPGLPAAATSSSFWKMRRAFPGVKKANNMYFIIFVRRLSIGAIYEYMIYYIIYFENKCASAIEEYGSIYSYCCIVAHSSPTLYYIGTEGC